MSFCPRVVDLGVSGLMCGGGLGGWGMFLGCCGCCGGCSEAGVVVPEGEDLVVVGGDCPVLGVEFVVVVLAKEYEIF